MKNVIKTVCVIIGTIIGAGFASGREIYLFFSKYGNYGFLGIIVSSVFTGIIIYKVFSHLKGRDVKGYNEFLEILNIPNHIKSFINIIINTFLLISFYVMIAGFCAYFKQELNMAPIITGVVICAICYLTFLNKMDGVMKINTIMMPFLIFMICIIGVKNNLLNIQFQGLEVSQNTDWFLASLEYASYNSIILIPILIGLEKSAKGKEKIISASVTIIILILSAILYGILLKQDVNLQNIEIPLIYAVWKLGKGYAYIYGFVIVLAIFTSAVSAGYGFLQNCSTTKKGYKRLSLFICTSAIFVSGIGFSKLVDLLYPVFGVIGLLQVIIILLKRKAKY